MKSPHPNLLPTAMFYLDSHANGGEKGLSFASLSWLVSLTLTAVYSGLHLNLSTPQ